MTQKKMLAASELSKVALACCKIYISDSRNSRALQTIRAVAESHERAPLLHEFKDTEYNRVGYTLVGALPSAQKQEAGRGKDAGLSSFSRLPLQIAVLDIVRAALESLNLEEHCGTHPRVGVVDHICFHPLGSAGLEQAASLARSVAASIGSRFKVPTYLYGAAHQQGRALDSVRRDLGYYRCNSQGQWIGGLSNISSSFSPDFGPSACLNKRSGMVVVGASPWVMNYNVPILSNDLRAARRIARKVSSRGGGLPQVQAMALLHGDDFIEVACNLLDTAVTSPDIVQTQVSILAEEEGIAVRQGYLTGYSEQEVYALACQKIFP
ncbi:hypothetical protein O6H91_06G004700 [Diphasiastrum complanatum]|uniref:Uncharacterized protein n=1 Tax=Diphasiastrum complanatum TaxID=34168 RepID=A0ACC2DAG3_DIPCM|nr:hypothetical protein O6H91_06G004700 [Diphasiastrum complanatum]